MRGIILIYIIMIILSCHKLYAEAAYSLKSLNYRSISYPIMRIEVLSSCDSLSEDQKQAIKEEIKQSDQLYIAFSDRLIELWRLRYNNRWGEDIILDIAEQATFFLNYKRSEIETVDSSDLGIIAQILLELSKSKNAESKQHYINIVRALQRIRKEETILREKQKFQNLKKEFLK